MLVCLLVALRDGTEPASSSRPRSRAVRRNCPMRYERRRGPHRIVRPAARCCAIIKAGLEGARGTADEISYRDRTWNARARGDGS